MDVFVYSLLTNLIYFCSGYIVLNKQKLDIDGYFYLFFTGVIVLSFISLFLNFFFKLDPLLNSILYIAILLLFFLKKKFTFKFELRIIIFLIISSLISFLLIVYSNVNRPDAGLYHLPYVSIINESKIIFGISNIHFRFAHTSILQYLSALNNNYLFAANGISIPLASIISFLYIYFFNDVLRVITKKDKITYSKIFSLFIIIYISFKVNRYSGFGNDAVAHLSFFYLISYFLKKNIQEINLNKIIIISVFIFINKPMMGLVFLIPLYIFILNNYFKLDKIFSIIFSFPSLFLVLWLLKNIIISGCVIYPINITCFKNLNWTNSNQILEQSELGSAWAKGWPDRLDKNISMTEYNSNFNWVKSWSKTHLKYILKIITPFTLIVFLIAIYLKLNSRKSKIFDNYNDKTKIYFLLLFCTLGVVSFFLIFPIYRYGYSYLITFISLLAIYSNKQTVNSKKNQLIFKIFFLICLSVIPIKQLVKIYKNFPHKPIWPNIYTLDKKDKKYDKKLLNNNFYYYHAADGDNLCMYSPSPCTSYLLKDNFYYTKIFLYKAIILKDK